MTSRQQTLDQRRAERALRDVDSVNKLDDKLKEKYSNWARKTPANVQSSGLGQILAFLLAKAGPEGGRDGHKPEKRAARMLYQHISAWVMGEVEPDSKDDLLKWAVSHTSPDYRRATAEAMAYLNWLKRFAEAILPEPEDSGGNA